MKILLVEDEPALSKQITQYLSGSGYLCEYVSAFGAASEKISEYAYDCIILDIGLPDGNGLQLVNEIKKVQPKSGIIIISAKNSVEDKISGLDLGADDYLSKPFSIAELNSRIKSVLRRKLFDGTNQIVYNEIAINLDEKQVTVSGNPVVLTKKEYDLLLFFIANKRRVITKSSIAEHLWGDNADSLDSFDFIYTHIKNLRKKLLDKGCADYIGTVYGAGYKFGIS